MSIFRLQTWRTNRYDYGMIMNLNGFYSNGGKEEKGLKYFQRKYSYMCLIHKKCEFGGSLNLLDDNLYSKTHAFCIIFSIVEIFIQGQHKRMLK